ncbi:MAG TPA: glycosyltransferase [Acidimicrobiia bacterium]|nr:glycosyltransferase [Acidimicrobiia bacterium]
MTEAPIAGTTTPVVRWDHLRRLTGPHGLFEHARYETPRLGHGYTTDDNARALVVLSRAGSDPAGLRPYLDFVLAARTGEGWHNRMSVDGGWTDRVGSDDATGRAVWGLAEVISAGHEDKRVESAIVDGLGMSSRHLRATAYLLLGAAAAHRAGIAAAGRALRSGLSRLPMPTAGRWFWPEPRLTYANARVPEALIRAGAALDDAVVIDLGLTMLEWLVGIEWGETGFSFTPVRGRGPGERGPAFDQQPIEAWAMVDACAAAAAVDRSGEWETLMQHAAMWFLGSNDGGVPLYDHETGAGFDGLTADGVNLNRGAESTLAALGSVWSLQTAAPRSRR